MPTISHAILGGALALIFYVITNSEYWNSEKRFTERMVVLFSFNSFIGPDIFTMFYAFNIDTNQIPIKAFEHSLIGWPIWCLGIMWIWYYVINIKSTEGTQLSKRSTLLLLISAGEIHFFLDMLDDGVDLIGFGNWHVHLTLQGNFLIGMAYQYGPLHEIMPWFSMTEMFFIGLIFMIILIYSIFRWEFKYTLIIASLFLLTIFLLYFLFGSIVFGFENDLGVSLYFGTLLIIPLILMVLAIE
ncbi:MAG: hypothetical protein ACTSQJ_11010 [Promethearchaeota archaeon]